ncbi:hypothetical protein [Maritalea myrionectae]|uniref:hypothetical protein n=1 Tax=Maritalea myrionectae TaxID=454601 RepID=UPI0013C2DA8B|nr:hypothetical protein [Maritalea myrionectae]
MAKKKPHPKMGLKNSRGNLLQGGNSEKVEGGGTTLCFAFLEAGYEDGINIWQMLIAHISHAPYAYVKFRLI